MIESEPAHTETATAHLRDLLHLRKLPYAQLGWGIKASGVCQRLTGNPFPTIDHLYRALWRLRIDPVDFQRGVATGFDPEIYLWKRWTKGKTNRDRVLRLLRQLQRPPKRILGVAELAELADGLESLRFRDPAAARHQALEILRHPELEPYVASETLGVLGVLERHSGKVSNAAHCEGEALRLAFDNPRLKARTLQRIAMLVFFQGEDREAALEAILRARLIYTEQRDTSGVGKTWVDEAVVHNSCGDHRLAYEANTEALRHLADDDVENRYCAAQGQAVATALLGEVAEAKITLDEIDLPPGSLYLSSTLRYLHGELALALGQLEEANKHFLAVWDAFIELDFGPLEQALIRLRVAKTYHLQGDREALRETLGEIVALQDDLEHSVHAAALQELLGQVASGQVTCKLLETAYQKLREGTTNKVVPPLIASC